MTTTIVKPCDYDIEKLTFNPLLSNKKNQHRLSYYPLTTAPGAP